MRRLFTADPDPGQGESPPQPPPNDTIDSTAGADKADTIGSDDVVQEADQNEAPATEQTAPAEQSGDADEEQQREDPSA